MMATNTSAVQLKLGGFTIMCEAVAEALAEDGILELRSGRWGGESIILASLSFPKVFETNSFGLIRFGAFEMQKAAASGEITWFRARVDTDNIIEGSVGVRDTNVTMKDTMVYKDMELVLEGFGFVVKMQG